MNTFQNFDFSIFQVNKPVAEEEEVEDKVEFFGPLLEFMYCREKTVLLEGPAGTGKTRAALEKFHIWSEKYDGLRGAIVRKQRVDLSQSALYTFETFVLPKGHPAAKGPRRDYRRTYFYPNGSEIHVFGLTDRSHGENGAEKLKSTEWDWLLFEEGTECTFADYQAGLSRLRSGVVAFPQLVINFNPVISQHWIYKLRFDEGVKHFKTVHHDNPTYWKPCDGGSVEHPITKELGEWTKQGKTYVIEILSRLKGNARKRFFLGEPITPGDIVFPEFDYEKHISSSILKEIEEMPLSPEEKEKYISDTYDLGISCDWGTVHPLVIHLYFVHKVTGKMNRVLEFYRTRTLSDDAGKEFLRACGYEYDEESNSYSEVPYIEIEDSDEDSGEGRMFSFRIPLFEFNDDGDIIAQNCRVVTDHDLESRTLFTRATGLETELATKDVVIGIEEMKTCLRDGLLTYDNIDPIGGKDPDLVSKFEPATTVQEFSMYKYGKYLGGIHQLPVKRFDDGCCASRYFICAIRDIRKKDQKAEEVPNEFATDARQFLREESKIIEKYTVPEASRFIDEFELANAIFGLGSRGGKDAEWSDRTLF